jgi:hypothetical protein
VPRQRESLGRQFRRSPDHRRRPHLAGPRVLVVCGAERTEPDYLEGLKAWLPFPGLQVVAQKSGTGKDPRKVVQATARRAAQRGPYDEVWCVLDLDQFDLDAAMEEAARRNIRLAVSVPCFEFWLLLHHEDCGRPFPNAKAVERQLRRHVLPYDKTRIRFDKFKDGLPDAIKRARALHDGDGLGPNPSSGVWRLVETIMKEAG